MKVEIFLSYFKYFWFETTDVIPKKKKTNESEKTLKSFQLRMEKNQFDYFIKTSHDPQKIQYYIILTFYLYLVKQNN